MIKYHQTSGAIYLDDGLIGSGYSGFGPGMNNPASESIPNVGPIPKGMWHIVKWDDFHGSKGPIVAVLQPMGHDAHGRSAFLIHGDNNSANHTASHGCVIASRPIRTQLRASKQTELEVM